MNWSPHLGEYYTRTVVATFDVTTMRSQVTGKERKSYLLVGLASDLSCIALVHTLTGPLRPRPRAQAAASGLTKRRTFEFIGPGSPLEALQALLSGLASCLEPREEPKVGCAEARAVGSRCRRYRIEPRRRLREHPTRPLYGGS
jgi:hypothetical protein